MDQNTKEILLATVPASVSAVASAVITWLVTRSSQRQFFNQRWWERKAQTYDNIIGALGALDFVVREWLQLVEQHLTYSDEYKVSLVTQRNDALLTIKKLSTSGDFLITQTAADALRKAAAAIDTDLGLDPLAEVEKDFDAVKACTDVIKLEARRDLILSTAPSNPRK